MTTTLNFAHTYRSSRLLSFLQSAILIACVITVLVQWRHQMMYFKHCANKVVPIGICVLALAGLLVGAFCSLGNGLHQTDLACEGPEKDDQLTAIENLQWLSFIGTGCVAILAIVAYADVSTAAGCLATVLLPITCVALELVASIWREMSIANVLNTEDPESPMGSKTKAFVSAAPLVLAAAIIATSSVLLAHSNFAVAPLALMLAYACSHVWSFAGIVASQVLEEDKDLLDCEKTTEVLKLTMAPIYVPATLLRDKYNESQIPS